MILAKKIAMAVYTLFTTECLPLFEGFALHWDPHAETTDDNPEYICDTDLQWGTAETPPVNAQLVMDGTTEKHFQEFLRLQLRVQPKSKGSEDIDFAFAEHVQRLLCHNVLVQQVLRDKYFLLCSAPWKYTRSPDT